MSSLSNNMDLQKENEHLKKEIENYKAQLQAIQSPTNSSSKTQAKTGLSGPDSHVAIVVIGASGDLAKKKTFPSLFYLYCLNLLPPNFTVFGYARSKMNDEEFRKHASQYFKEYKDKAEAFLSKCFYASGQYNSAEDFEALNAIIEKHEGNFPGNRVFYMAVPPSVFVDVAKAVKAAAMSKTGWTRVIVEKPFGRDLDSSTELSNRLAELFSEEQLYRIDHYLGKEMVQNLMILRFANLVWEPLWNRHHVACVMITFKEPIGTEGRGGYFDEFGIIRDVMQNHLLQIMSLIAMEPPISMQAEDVRDEKVKVLRCCSPIALEDLVIGQYGRDAEGKTPSYLDDPGVPKDSVTPTFATAVIHVNNARWKGVPFILKCGKALDERKAEIRIQFHSNPGNVFPNAAKNELVLRVQPDEAVYMKFNAKAPGLSEEVVQTELDLTYKRRFDARLPDAYERLIYDVLRGDHNLFVRVDELDAAWRIFTPILHKLEQEKIKPEIYTFGSRGPASSDKLIENYGYIRNQDYKWEKKA